MQVQSFILPSFSLDSTQPIPSTYLTKKIEEIYRRAVISIGETLRNRFFLPLHGTLSQKHMAQLQKEKEFFQDFWDPEKPLRPEFFYQQKIRDHFSCEKKEITVDFKGEPLKVHYCLIQSKNNLSKEAHYNFVQILGNQSKIDNTITHIYPFLSSYLEKEEGVPARFILISQYDTIYENDYQTFKPKTLNEAGFVISEILKTLEETHGTLHQVFAHSIGSIVLGAALKYFGRTLRAIPSPTVEVPISFFEARIQEIALFFKTFCEILLYPLTGRISLELPKEEELISSKVFKTFPKNIHFDRGPSCVEELSKKLFAGKLLYQLGKLAGWDLDIGKEIFLFIKDTKELPSIAISNTLQDHYFAGDANLCMSPYIQRLAEEEKVSTLLMDIVQQHAHSFAHHSLDPGFFNRYHLVHDFSKQSFIKGKETLAEAVIRRSLPLPSKDPWSFPEPYPY